MPAKRPLSGSLSLSWGDYWSGKAEQVSASLVYKLPPWLTVSLNGDRTSARLPEGDFTATILTARIDYSASPRLSLSSLVQYPRKDEPRSKVHRKGRLRSGKSLRPGS